MLSERLLQSTDRNCWVGGRRTVAGISPSARQSFDHDYDYDYDSDSDHDRENEMRILYLDIDTLRPDHLGCYGYARNTSPNIDRIAARGCRFENFYASDAPCLPSRSALFSGMFGIHNGAVNHGGARADMFNAGPERGFRKSISEQGWIAQLRRAGLRTVSVSPFAERHSAWDFCAGWNEMYNPGMGGMESAEHVQPYAEDWLRRNADSDNWFYHVHFWDPHTPYRVPLEFGDPFADEPLPPEADWVSEERIRQGFQAFGSHSPQDLGGFSNTGGPQWPRVPAVIRSKDDYKRWIDGYDTGILYMDAHFGRLLDILDEKGVLDDTVIIISSDHGENQGELNIYGDHQTACESTARVPLVIHWPGCEGATGVRSGLHYGRSFAADLRDGSDTGHESLVLSQLAWACQRSVRWDRYLLLRTYDPGMKDLRPVQLYDVEQDPHMTTDLTEAHPELVDRGLALLERWTTTNMMTSTQAVDPLWQVMREGGAFHTRRQLTRYIEHLRATGREEHIPRLEAVYRDRPCVQFGPLY
jgi:arylsulfatase A-like enzyme